MVSLRLTGSCELVCFQQVQSDEEIDNVNVNIQAAVKSPTRVRRDDRVGNYQQSDATHNMLEVLNATLTFYLILAGFFQLISIRQSIHCTYKMGTE